MSSVPVIVFPTSLDFYLGDPSTHKRVLTLYNPLEVPVAFKVLCTNPSFYAVVEPEGQILPQKCIDIVVRHVAVSSPKALNQVDKFRLTILDHSNVKNPESLGYPDGDSGSSSLPHGQQLVAQPERKESLTHSRSTEYHQPNYVACFAAVICIAALFLPTEGENQSSSVSSSSSFWSYPWLILTVNQKLVFAYVLGLVTMAILRVA